MGALILPTQENTDRLAPSVAAARQGPEVLCATWQAMAAAGTLPSDIDISEPAGIDWQQITDVLLTMAEFERCALLGKLPEAGLWCRDATGRLAEIPVPTEEQPAGGPAHPKRI
jgi:hypothetical protein